MTAPELLGNAEPLGTSFAHSADMGVNATRSEGPDRTRESRTSEAREAADSKATEARAVDPTQEAQATDPTAEARAVDPTAEPAGRRPTAASARDARTVAAADPVAGQLRAQLEAQLTGPADIVPAQAVVETPAGETPARDNVTREIMASALEQRWGVDMGHDAASSARIAEQDLTEILDTDGPIGAQARALAGDLVGLHAVSAGPGAGLDFLDEAQQERLSEVLGEDFATIEANYNERRAAAERLESMPELADAARTAFLGQGSAAWGEHVNLIENLTDNLVSGRSFQSTNEIGKLNDLFQHLQTSGNVEGYQQMVAALGYHATDEQAANIESSINAAGVFNAMNLTAGMVDVLGASRALRMSGGSLPRLRGLTGANLALSLRQQAGLSRLAQQARNEILRDPRLLDEYLSPEQLAAMRNERWVFHANMGHAIEQRVAAHMRREGVSNPDSVFRGMEWTGTSNTAYDFRNADGMTFELTSGSSRSIFDHANRPGVDIVVTYDPIPPGAYDDFLRAFE
ncbi:MAG: hypothetical protein AAFU79_06905 [Myxococcota bacterium]